MSIMDLFKSASPVGDSNKDTKQQQQPQNGKENLSENPPTDNGNGKMPGTEPIDQNPLDVYKKMFENNTSSELEAPSFKLDPKVLGDVSSKMDFTRGIQQETLQKATSGDVSALMDIIKKVGQNSYRAAIEHNTALTDTFINQRGDFENKKLERGVKQQLTSSALSETANYNHPVIKAELNRVANQFSSSNPDASPQEIAKAAKKYIDDLYTAMNPSTKKDGDNSEEGEMDWSKYLSA